VGVCKSQEVKKEGVSYSYRTAQPITFAYFRTWRVLGSWSYKTYPGAKVVHLFRNTKELDGIILPFFLLNSKKNSKFLKILKKTDIGLLHRIYLLYQRKKFYTFLKTD